MRSTVCVCVVQLPTVFYPLIMLPTLAGERPDLQFGPTEGMPSFLQRPCQVVLRVDRIEMESKIFLSRWT